MRLRWRPLLTIALLLLAIGLILSSLHLLPLNFLSVQQKPNQEPQKVYEYYIIYDEKTGEELMYVPLVVSVGDDILTEDDRLYTIIRVEENRAYARFVEEDL